MPPYSANVSQAQQRKMFALAEEGKVSKEDAIGRARASKGKNLPRYVGKPTAGGRGMSGRR